MPKPTKLHAKGKPTSIQKPVTIDDTDSVDPEETAKQFQLELCWCIQQLEKTLSDNKAEQKHLQETWKVLTVLKNNNQPIIRKRQLMRTHFGDYRAKMAAEEKKLAKMASKIKISDSSSTPKATFLRKSAFLSTGDSSFRFNFNVPADQIDTGNPEPAMQSSNVGNTEEKVIEPAETNDSAKPFKFKFSDTEFKFNFNNS
ncbi:UPF0488 protein CG14286 [Plutella xylostella]|uniref:UPF0488 protein CG14286 n=1 Tax=Plutella xylostella TaxID=51655 RepID=UPI0020322FD4|nr:UPF0488 protein CG14286 [Plutella xylostella]